MKGNRNVFSYKLKTIRVEAKPLQVTKHSMTLLISAMLVSLIFSQAISSFTNVAMIESTGEILAGNEVWADSGDLADVQSAVNAVVALGGGTVYVPEGHWYVALTSSNYVDIPGGVNIIGMGKNITVYELGEPSPTNGHIFFFHGENGKPIRLSGIGFYGLATGYGYSAVIISSVIDFRVDHCYFTRWVFSGIHTNNDYRTGNRGVIDHNEFYDIVDWTLGIGYGVGVISTYTMSQYYWNPNIEDYLGKYTMDTVFIEDNSFDAVRHATCSYAGAHIVERFNTFTNMKVGYQSGYADQHGARSGTYAGRVIEVYNNIFYNPSTNSYYKYERARAVAFRGGGGIVFNNTAYDMSTFVWMSSAEAEGNDQYPECWHHDIWIWNNELHNISMLVENSASSYGITEGEDYFLRAPDQALDGFAYMPYPYPHPLTLEETP